MLITGIVIAYFVIGLLVAPIIETVFNVVDKHRDQDYVTAFVFWPLWSIFVLCFLFVCLCLYVIDKTVEGFSAMKLVNKVLNWYKVYCNKVNAVINGVPKQS